jgi:hypothetical protein
VALDPVVVHCLRSVERAERISGSSRVRGKGIEGQRG